MPVKQKPDILLYLRSLGEKIGGLREKLPVTQNVRSLLDAAYHGARPVHSPHVGALYHLSRRDAVQFWRDVKARRFGTTAARRPKGLKRIYGDAARSC